MAGKPGRPRKNPIITVERVLRPSLTNKKADPFGKYKTEPDKFYYRALNTKATNMRIREAQGYQPIGGSEFGDLVLAKLPKEQREMREQELRDKNKAQLEAVKEQFKEEGRKHGVEVYEDTEETEET